MFGITRVNYIYIYKTQEPLLSYETIYMFYVTHVQNTFGVDPF